MNVNMVMNVCLCLCLSNHVPEFIVKELIGLEMILNWIKKLQNN